MCGLLGFDPHDFFSSGVISTTPVHVSGSLHIYVRTNDVWVSTGDWYRRQAEAKRTTMTKPSRASEWNGTRRSTPQGGRDTGTASARTGTDTGAYFTEVKQQRDK